MAVIAGGATFDEAAQAVMAKAVDLLSAGGMDRIDAGFMMSAGGHLRTENLNQSGFLSSQDPTLIDAVQANGSIKDGYDLGNILPANMSLSDALSDLTLQFQIQGGGTKMKAGDIVVPEPTTLGLIGVGAMGLLARRRRRRC